MIFHEFSRISRTEFKINLTTITMCANISTGLKRSFMKEIIWNAKARDFVRSLDEDTRREIGTLLMLIQYGNKLGEPQSKPLKNIYPSAHELRVKDRKGAYRVIYVLNIGDKILIPHAFTEKTQKTPQKEIELSIKRLRELINENK